MGAVGRGSGPCAFKRFEYMEKHRFQRRELGGKSVESGSNVKRQINKQVSGIVVVAQ